MAASIVSQTIMNGSRNLVVKTHIVGDAAGDVTSSLLIDVSAFSATDVKVMAVQSTLAGFSAVLLWDATTDTQAWSIADGDVNQNFSAFGGLINNAGAGKTGDIMITTHGLAAGDEGTIVLYLKKK